MRHYDEVKTKERKNLPKTTVVPKILIALQECYHGCHGPGTGVPYTLTSQRSALDRSHWRAHQDRASPWMADEGLANRIHSQGRNMLIRLSKCSIRGVA